MDRLRKRGEELAVAAPARPSGRDGVMASPPQPSAAAAVAAGTLEGARCWSAAFQHVLTASTVTYDQADGSLSHTPRAWTDSQATGGGHRGR